MRIGIISAMQKEFNLLLSEVKNKKETNLANRLFVEGELWGKDVVLVYSQWGTTPAASTTANLINVFNAQQIIFTGVAGGLQDKIKIGDIVIAETLHAYDVDASPFHPRFFLPLIGEGGIKANKEINEKLQKAADKFLSEKNKFISRDNVAFFNLNEAEIHLGDIVTTDAFVKDISVREDMVKNFPKAYAAEMEGVSVAWVAFEHNVPCGVIRTISDSANHNSHMDYPRFLDNVANIYSLEIIRNYLSLL